MRGHERNGEREWHESGGLQAPRNLGAMPRPHRQRPRAVAARLARFLVSFQWWCWVLAALVLVLFGAMRSLDQGEEEWRDEEYCANVYTGRVPDYKGTYQDACIAGRVRAASQPGS